MKVNSLLRRRTLLLVTSLTIATACAKPANDNRVTSDIQSKLSADSGLQGKQLSVQSDKGVVTLSGTVDNDAQREAAAKYAAAEPGVKTVINNLQVGSMQAAGGEPEPAATPAPAPEPAPAAKSSKSSKPSPSQRRLRHASDSNDQMAQATPP